MVKAHLISPESVLALCQQMYGKTPECWLLGIRGYQFEFGEDLTGGARTNLDEALSHLIGFFAEHKDVEGE